jgi:hypothetical protein
VVARFLVLIELVLVVFLDIEHVVCRQLDVFAPSVYVPASAKRSSVSAARVKFGRRIKPVIEVRVLIIDVYYVLLLLLSIRLLGVTPQQERALFELLIQIV